jgi:hypothetical protein
MAALLIADELWDARDQLQQLDAAGVEEVPQPAVAAQAVSL